MGNGRYKPSTLCDGNGNGWEILNFSTWTTWRFFGKSLNHWWLVFSSGRHVWSDYQRNMIYHIKKRWITMIRESCLFPLGEAWDFMKLGCTIQFHQSSPYLTGSILRGWLSGDGLVDFSGVDGFQITHFPAGQILTRMLFFERVEFLEGFYFNRDHW